MSKFDHNALVHKVLNVFLKCAVYSAFSAKEVYGSMCKSGVSDQGRIYFAL